VPSEEGDHRGRDGGVEHGVEHLGRAAGEERHEPELNRVGGDGDDPRREDPIPRSLHAPTLGSPTGGGQPPCGTPSSDEDAPPAFWTTFCEA